jgi:hypothetical protein
MNKETNIHSVANFDPSEYEIEEYLDNQRPRYCGGPVAGWAAEVENWENTMASYFPHWKAANLFPEQNIHKCRHCGNTNVRYIVAVWHSPSARNVVFGSDCVAHLGFAGRDDFKASRVRARAEQGNARMRVFKLREEFLAANPAVLDAITAAADPVHANNAFVRDVLSKLNRYGSLSENQVNAFVKSLARDRDNELVKAHRAEAEAARRATATPAPNGRVTVQGEVVSVKDYDGQFGICWKMLVLLDTGSKVFVSVPGGIDQTTLRGRKVRFTASFTPSATDPLFAIGKRPTKAELI